MGELHLPRATPGGLHASAAASSSFAGLGEVRRPTRELHLPRATPGGLRASAAASSGSAGLGEVRRPKGELHLPQAGELRRSRREVRWLRSGRSVGCRAGKELRSPPRELPQRGAPPAALGHIAGRAWGSGSLHGSVARGVEKDSWTGPTCQYGGGKR